MPYTPTAWVDGASPAISAANLNKLEGGVRDAYGAPAALAGAAAATRYVGGTASGAPTTGTFAVGDFVIDQTGKVWVCTTAGTPGTWTQAGGSGGDMSRIAETVLTAAAASVTFSAIPATYRHLLVAFSVRSDRAAANTDELALRFNADTAGNYDWQRIYANNTTLAADQQLADTSIYGGIITGAASTAGFQGVGDVLIPDYRGTTLHKGAVVRNATRHSSTGAFFLTHIGGTWKNTAAVTSVTLLSRNGANFVAGCAFTLYGMK